MFGQKHTVNSRKFARAADLVGGRYPIGLTVEKYMDLFSDVKRFSVSLFSLVDSSLTAGISASNINEALNAINDSSGSSSSNSGAGSTNRQIKALGLMNADGSDLTESQRPSATCNYPRHTYTNGQTSITIDFGRSLFYDGLLYPYFEVTFANGTSNLAVGAIIGGVDFEGYGQIPIYSGSVSTLNFVYAFGSLSVEERYSSLISSVVDIGRNSSVTLNANGLSNLSNYTKAYFGAFESTAIGNNQNIIISAPDSAFSGPIRIESLDPYDSFLTYQNFRIV